MPNDFMQLSYNFIGLIAAYTNKYVIGKENIGFWICYRKEQLMKFKRTFLISSNASFFIIAHRYTVCWGS